VWWCFLLQDHRALTGRCWLLSCSNRVCPVMENACCCCCCCCMGESNRLVNSVGVLQSSLRRPELKLWLTSSQQQQNPHAVCSSAVRRTHNTRNQQYQQVCGGIYSFLPACLRRRHCRACNADVIQLNVCVGTLHLEFFAQYRSNHLSAYLHMSVCFFRRMSRSGYLIRTVSYTTHYYATILSIWRWHA